jgi:hypothetical protein
METEACLQLPSGMCAGVIEYSLGKSDISLYFCFTLRQLYKRTGLKLPLFLHMDSMAPTMYQTLIEELRRMG